MRYTTARRTYRRKKTTRGPFRKKGITALTRVVNKLKRQIPAALTKHYLYGSFTTTANGFVSPYWSQNLCNFNTLQPCFGTGTTDVNGNNHWKLDKIDIDIILNNNTEPLNLYLNMFIVSLKKGSNLINSATGNLIDLTGGTTPVSTNHYVSNAVSNLTQIYLNPDEFEIHFRKRLVLGNNNISNYVATGAGNDDVKGTYRKKWTLYPNCNVKNPIGNVKDMIYNTNEAHQYYIIIFNDNSNVDLETPVGYINCLYTIRVPGG